MGVGGCRPLARARSCVETGNLKWKGPAGCPLPHLLPVVPSPRPVNVSSELCLSQGRSVPMSHPGSETIVTSEADDTYTFPKCDSTDVRFMQKVV